MVSRLESCIYLTLWLPFSLFIVIYAQLSDHVPKVTIQ
jgi:hypothetical protein